MAALLVDAAGEGAAAAAAAGAALEPSGVLGGALAAAGFSAAAELEEAVAAGASFRAEEVRLTAGLVGVPGLAAAAAGFVGVAGLAAAEAAGLLVPVLLLLLEGLATLEDIKVSPLVGELLLAELDAAFGLRVTVAAGLTVPSLPAAAGLAAPGLLPAEPARAGSLPSCLAAAGACAQLGLSSARHPVPVCCCRRKR